MKRPLLATGLIVLLLIGGFTLASALSGSGKKSVSGAQHAGSPTGTGSCGLPCQQTHGRSGGSKTPTSAPTGTVSCGLPCQQGGTSPLGTTTSTDGAGESGTTKQQITGQSNSGPGGSHSTTGSSSTTSTSASTTPNGSSPGNGGGNGTTTTNRSTTTIGTTTPAPGSPAPPTGLAVHATASSLTLSWQPSQSAASYGVYLRGQRLNSVTATSYTFSALTCESSYQLAVDAASTSGLRSDPSSVQAQTASCPSGIYVAPGGTNSDCANSSPSDACPSLNDAYQAARPGELITLLAGSYGNQQITYDSSKGATAVQVVADGQVTLGTLSLYGVNHLSINGSSSMRIGALTIGPQSSHDSSYLLLENIALSGPAQISSADHLTVESLDSSGTVSFSGGSSYLTLADLYFHDVAGDCLSFGGSTAVTVEASRFYGCGGDYLTSDSAGRYSGWLVQNNMFAGCGLVAIDGRASWSGALRFRYNSFASSCAKVSLQHADSLGKQLQISFVANIGGLSSCLRPTNAKVSYSHNLWSLNCGVTDRSGNPDFISISSASPNLHIGAGSDAIDGGDPANYPTGDLDNTRRFCGQAPDIGADERC